RIARDLCRAEGGSGSALRCLGHGSYGRGHRPVLTPLSLVLCLDRAVPLLPPSTIGTLFDGRQSVALLRAGRAGSRGCQDRVRGRDLWAVRRDRVPGAVAPFLRARRCNLDRGENMSAETTAAAGQPRGASRYFEHIAEGRGPVAEVEPVCLYLETT